jgi:diguanylate cyclase (GGDEF)-like protein/PAS domain S-box-containing protein
MPPPWSLVRVALLLSFLSFASRFLNQGSWAVGGVTILWPSNGLLMGILLCSPKRHWPAYLAVAGTIDFLFNVSLHDTLSIGAYLSCCNMLEAVLGAMLLYPVIAARPDLTQRKQLVVFLCCGVLVPPLVASLAASLAQDGQFAQPTLHNFLRWFTADALGIAIVTPLYLAFDQHHGFADRSRREVLSLFAILAMVTFGVFWQTRFPFLFVVLPFLLLLGMRLGLAGSALGLLLVTIVGGFLSNFRHGPVGLARTDSPAERDLVFQFFIAISMLLLYIVEVLMAESTRLQNHLRGSERRFRLLAEASNDIIFLSDLHGRRTYVSPSVVEVLGWSTDEILAGTFRDLVHPDDGVALQRMLDTYRATRILPPPGDFRYRKADGAYLWLEISMRLYSDEVDGEPAGFVCVARDISRRKREEADLQRTLKTANHLACSDALTGIANRRYFDEVLEREWLRAAREQTSLSLILLDVDRFKAYNDAFGHLSGDECLRKIVAAIHPLISRPADLLARYGGEEFVVVLPNTEPEGARQMAKWVRQAVQQCRLPHPGNPPHDIVTISVGCATVKPHPQFTHLHLVEAADSALYRAKSSGRNAVQIANEMLDAGSVLLKG